MATFHAGNVVSPHYEVTAMSNQAGGSVSIQMTITDTDGLESRHGDQLAQVVIDAMRQLPGLTHLHAQRTDVVTTVIPS